MNSIFAPGNVLLAIAMNGFLDQTPVQNPPLTDFRPVFLTVGGALVGVILTIIVQAINSRSQRRHENEGKIFEARLALYLELVDLADVMPKHGLRVRQSNAALSQLIERRKEILQEIEKCNIKAEAVKQQARRVADANDKAGLTAVRVEISETESELGRLIAKLGALEEVQGRKITDEAAEAIKQLDIDNQKLSNSMSRIAILSHTVTLDAVVALMEAANGTKELKGRELTKVRQTIRRELGIGRPWIEKVQDWRAHRELDRTSRLTDLNQESSSKGEAGFDAPSPP